jgi:hypothetical protein
MAITPSTQAPPFHGDSNSALKKKRIRHDSTQREFEVIVDRDPTGKYHVVDRLRDQQKTPLASNISATSNAPPLPRNFNPLPLTNASN